MRHYLLYCSFIKVPATLMGTLTHLCEWTRQPECFTEENHIRDGHWENVLPGESASPGGMCPDCDAKLTLNFIREFV